MTSPLTFEDASVKIPPFEDVEDGMMPREAKGITEIGEGGQCADQLDRANASRTLTIIIFKLMHVKSTSGITTLGRDT